MPELTATTGDVRDWGGKTIAGVSDRELQRVLTAAIRGVQLRVEDWRTWTDEDITTMNQAVIMQTARLWSRKSSPNGVAGFGGDGAVVRFSRFDPDIDSMLQPFVIPGIA